MGYAPAAFETERITARRVLPQNFAEMHLLYGNRDVMKTITGKVLTPQETRDRLEMHTKHWEQRGYGLWIARVDGVVAGQIMLVRRLTDCTAIELGYAFRRQFWGRGYATEAARALLRIAFESLKERDVIGITGLANAASQGVMVKAGMRFRRQYNFLGNPEHALFGIKVEEWRSNRAQLSC